MVHQPCSLCQRPPFFEQTETWINSCNLCFQLIKANNTSISITNLKTQDVLILTQNQVSLLDSLENSVSEKQQDLLQQISINIRKIKDGKFRGDKQEKNVYQFVNERYLSEIQRIMEIKRKALEEIIQMCSGGIKTKNILLETKYQNQVVSKENSSKTSTKIQKSLVTATQQNIFKLIKNICKNNQQTLFTDKFSIISEIKAIKINQIKALEAPKRQSAISRNHFSHNVSKQNSIDKIIPKLELSKKKSLRNLHSTNIDPSIPFLKLKTQTSSTKNQIKQLLSNLDHNPQGFRDTTNRPNTSRKVPPQPMSQCISSALKSTTVTNNNTTLSLSTFDISKLAFDCYLNMTEITHQKSIVSIKLVKVGMVDHQFNLLLCFAARHENLKNIVATNNSLTEESLQMLLNFVKKIRQLEKVYMGNNPIKALPGKQLIKQIKSHGIQSIYL